MLFIDDLVRAFRLAAEKIERTAGEVFNIGGGPGNTLSVWHELAAREPIPPVQYASARPGEQRHVEADVTRGERLLSWQPRVPFAEGLTQTVRWARAAAGSSA